MVHGDLRDGGTQNALNLYCNAALATRKVDILKEICGLDARSVGEALAAVGPEQLADETPWRCGEMPWERDSAPYDACVDRIMRVRCVILAEWCVAAHELICDAAEGPPIDDPCVAARLLPRELLRRKISWRTTIRAHETVGAIRRRGGEAEVDEAAVTFGIEEDVLRFEVAICIARHVDMRESGEDLGKIERRSIRTEAAVALELGEKFAARYVLEDKIDSPRVLKRPKQPHDERMPQLRKNIPLIPEMALVVMLGDIALRDCFERHISSVLSTPRQRHLAHDLRRRRVVHPGTDEACDS